MGVRSRCERSATSSRSWASSSPTRSPSPLSTRPTVTTSGGPDGTTRASRSPAPSRSATSDRSSTERESRRAIRSPATTVAARSRTPIPARTAHERGTPSASTASGTNVRTTASPSGPPTGRRTSTPPTVRACRARPSEASSTAGLGEAAAPTVVPSGRKTVVAVDPSLTASTAASRRARSCVPPPANTATACASWRAPARPRSAASERASRPSGTRRASSTTEVIASP